MYGLGEQMESRHKESLSREKNKLKRATKA